MLGEDGVDDALRRGRRHNEAVLELLRDDFPAQVRRLRTSLNEQGQGDIEPFVETFRSTARDQLADTDISLHDAEEVSRGLDDVIETARRGADAVCDRMLSVGGELAGLRERRDAHNDPVSAVILAIGALLIAGAMFSCAPAGGRTCSDPQYFSFVRLIIVALLLLLA